jgi:restriction system protein
MAMSRSKRQDEAVGSLFGLFVLLSTVYGSDWLYKNYGIKQVWTGYGITFAVSIAIGLVLWLVIQEVFQLPGSRVYRKRMKSLELADVDSMAGRDFEKYVALLFQHQGYKVKLTGRSGDLGVDVIAVKEEERLAIQCKRYSQKVPRNAVSDAVAGMTHYKCNRAMVVTTNYFQPGAHQLAKSNKVQLVDRDLLSQWIHDFQDAKQNNKTA